MTDERRAKREAGRRKRASRRLCRAWIALVLLGCCPACLDRSGIASGDVPPADDGGTTGEGDVGRDDGGADADDALAVDDGDDEAPDVVEDEGGGVEADADLDAEAEAEAAADADADDAADESSDDGEVPAEDADAAEADVGPTCGGAPVGGFCWYAGVEGDSCDTTCTSHGGCDIAGTRDYAGSGGTDAQCVAVLAALGYGAWPHQDWSNNDLGCHFAWASWTYWSTARETTCDARAGGAAAVRRMCACAM